MSIEFAPNGEYFFTPGFAIISQWGIMYNIEEIFREAVLNELGGKWGAQAKLAKAAEIHPPYLNGILKGAKLGNEEVRRKIAAALGYKGRKYEDFLDIGRAIVEGRPMPEPPCDYLNDEELSDRGFIAVPFSADMKLSAGCGGTIPYTDDEKSSPVIIHGPTLKRRNARGLQAFRVGGDSMEPVIAAGGLVIADTTKNELRHIKDGGLYVLCWDLHDGECAVKKLRWAEKGRLLSIESANEFYPPVFKSANEITLIGRVIWSCREHKA